MARRNQDKPQQPKVAPVVEVTPTASVEVLPAAGVNDTQGTDIVIPAVDLALSAAPASDAAITIYPLRSYLDGKEIRQAGGQGYKSPRHEACLLIAKGLATDKNPKV